MNKVLHTKYGTATISDTGYYRIQSVKEGNYHKYLHRLIFEDFYGFKVPKNYIIHHKDENKLNNCILNLQLISNKEHSSIHNKGENNYFYGKKLSEEHKQKLSESHKGKKLSEEHKQKLRGNTPWNKGKKLKPLSEEHKRKISEANKGRKVSEETRRKISESNKGKHGNPAWNKCKKMSEEYKRKLSKSHENKYATIFKNGKTEDGKQRFGIWKDKKRIKSSIKPSKLLEWFTKEYPKEILVLKIFN